MTVSAEHEWLRQATGSSVLEFYAQLGVELKDNGSEEASVRCFANPSAHNRDDRNPSCSVNLLTGLFNCQGCGESGNAYAAALALGRSEAYARQLARSYGLFLETAPTPAEKKPRMPTEPKLKKWRCALRENPVILRRLQELKGWDPRAVVRLGVGWDGERLVLPVRAGAKRKIVGVVRYLPGGKPKMLAFPGSKRDLFPCLELIHRSRPLFVVEGETDAIAVWSAGFYAVAVPGAGSWRSEWAQRFVGRKQIVVLHDCDRPGRELAARLAVALPQARVVDIEPGREDGYDVGDVVREAANEGGIWQATRLLENLL